MTVEAMIEQYVQSWNELNEESIKAAFAKCWDAAATYTDPNFELVNGVDGITKLAVGSHEKLPGRIFYVQVQPDHHHNTGLYTWGVTIPGHAPREGRDYFEFNDGFKITRLVSFFAPLT